MWTFKSEAGRALSCPRSHPCKWLALWPYRPHMWTWGSKWLQRCRIISKWLGVIILKLVKMLATCGLCITEGPLGLLAGLFLSLSAVLTPFPLFGGSQHFVCCRLEESVTQWFWKGKNQTFLCLSLQWSWGPLCRQWEARVLYLGPFLLLADARSS